MTAVLIAPVWTNQVWFPSISKEFGQPSNPSAYSSQHLEKLTGHNPPNGNGGPPTYGHMACLRRSITQKDFQMELLKSSRSCDEFQQRRHILEHGDSGIAGVLNRVLIHFQLLLA